MRHPTCIIEGLACRLTLCILEQMIYNFINSVQISLIQTLKLIAFSWTIHWCQWQNILMADETRMPGFWGYPPPPIESCWIPQVKTRSKDLEDIGHGQRSWHATDLLMLVIICTKYGKNPCRTVDATEQTPFSRSRPNDLENIGQRSLYATHPLMPIMIYAKYGKNPSRTVDFFQGQDWEI